jgi:uncharacterized protein (DUF952 family)
MIIHHITTEAEWQQAKDSGYYEAPSLHTEGFIHCSTIQQVEGVLERYFAGQTGLVKLTIDTDMLENELKYELSPSLNDEFPHVYGPINLSAVVNVANISAPQGTSSTSE